jgi:hypothetical protein
MRETSNLIHELGTDQILAENEAARPQLSRFLRRMRDEPDVAEVLRVEMSVHLEGVETTVAQMAAKTAGGE